MFLRKIRDCIIKKQETWLNKAVCFKCCPNIHFLWLHAHSKLYLAWIRATKTCKPTYSIYLLGALLQGVGDTAGKTVGGLTDTQLQVLVRSSTTQRAKWVTRPRLWERDPIGSVGGQNQTADNPNNNNNNNNILPATYMYHSRMV